MRPVILLAWLNNIDLAVDALRARLAEITGALQEPAALQAARDARAQAEAELATCQVRQQDRERVQQDIAGKLARAQNRLYSGQVRVPRELEGAEQDVQQLRRQLEGAEDELLEALIAIEAAAETCAERRSELARLTAERQTLETNLRAEQARLLERLAIEEARSAAARQAVPADLLPLYDALRPRRAGRAVAELDGDVCSACRVAVSPVTLEAARYGGDLVYCENCGRLLWGE